VEDVEEAEDFVLYRKPSEEGGGVVGCRPEFRWKCEEDEEQVEWPD